MPTYEEFLASKAVRHQSAGIIVPADKLHPRLFPFQRDVVSWALAKGKAALFEECGLGKTLQELVWADEVCKAAGGKVLILTPLAVAAQTVREAAKFGIEGVGYFHNFAQFGLLGARICVTNYEKLHLFDPSEFAGVVLDESSILKSFTGSTRNQIIEAFAATPYKLAATATPAPNDYTEIGNHAEFLGIMSRTEMLAEYFVHDGGSTSSWRIKGHAEAAFWKWVTTWAVTLRSPSDIGHDAGRYNLPPLCTENHIIHIDDAESDNLFASQALSLTDQRKAKRKSLSARVEEVARIVATKPNEPWVIWCELNDEADAVEKAVPFAVQVAGSDKPEFKESIAEGFTDGGVRILVSKSSIFGFGMNWQHCANVIFAGVSNSYEQTYQAIRRCWRFGQEKPVNVHFVLSEAEEPILKNLHRKEAEAEQMQASMVSVMRSVSEWQRLSTSRETNDYSPKQTIRLPEWLRSEN